MSDSQLLAGRRIALVGRFAGIDHRAVAEMIRERGGDAVENLSSDADLVVVGEHCLPFDEQGRLERYLVDLAEPNASDARREVITQTEFWELLGLVDQSQHVHRLYTPRMLASIVGVPVAVIRRWQRLGLIRPAREVLRLPYYDFQEVATARRLVELLAAGIPPREIKRQLAALGRYLPRVDRPLAQLSVMLAGKELLLRQGDGLVEPGGQLRFDFEQLEETPARPSATPAEYVVDRSLEPDDLIDAAHEYEDAGDLAGAIEGYRAALAAGGPQPRWCFELAELLYAVNDLSAARERYYMAIELDEDFVEARANLGCVLAELGETALAAAALHGALELHPDFPDAHFHLALALEQLGEADDARQHWKEFLDLAPESPWADTARQRLK